MNAAAKDSRTPNVVLIVFDYMGYADIEPFGPGGEIRTPNIRRLAETGRSYTTCYAAAPICGPSRAALMTGRYPRRLGFEQNLKRDQLEGEGGLKVFGREGPGLVASSRQFVLADEFALGEDHWRRYSRRG